jgi:Phage integrase, N-terminal SAM-like domain
MKPGADAERDVTAIRLPYWGRVVPAEGVVPWLVVDPAGEPVEPILRFLRDFVARDNRAGSVRSYCYALLRWWRWLMVIEVEWDQVTSADVRDFVLWLGQAVKRRSAARTVSAATAGTVNPVTRKQCGPSEPVWWTLRQPLRPLTYDAARMVFTRANQLLGANWTLHDLRHSAAKRMQGRGSSRGGAGAMGTSGTCCGVLLLIFGPKRADPAAARMPTSGRCVC